MHRLLLTVLAFCIGGCGAEVASTAASGGVSKAQEVRQAQQNLERAQQKLDAATRVGQERAAEAEKSVGY
jgi:hypothetical protein